jgi:hypothetical protein
MAAKSRTKYWRVSEKIYELNRHNESQARAFAFLLYGKKRIGCKRVKLKECCYLYWFAQWSRRC